MAQGFRQKFEKDLKDKLVQKSNSRLSEEACLIKMFKYFDVAEVGAVNFIQFQRVLEKSGMYFPEEQLAPLFAEYDTDKSGSLDYKEFAMAIFGSEASKQAALQRKKKIEPQTAESLIKAFRQKLLRRGAKSIIGIGRIFKIMDDNRSGTLDIAEFAKGVYESKLDLTDLDIKTLFRAFDRNNDGSISYDEFLRTVKGDMNQRRQELVMQAFAKLDRDGNGHVDFYDIKDTYNAKRHPAVLEGRKTERQVLEEFLATFELALSGEGDGKVTPEEFTEYYTAVSASIDRDDYFEQMINNSWNLTGDAVTYQKFKKGWSLKEDETQVAGAAGKAGPGGPLARRAAGTYGGFQSHPTGKATIYSGMQSSDNPFENATKYYAGQEAPPRKSLAFESQKKDYTLKEVPGQQTYASSMADRINTEVYQQHKETHVPKQAFPTPSNRESMNAQNQLEIRKFKERIANRGAKGLIGLKKQFKLMDSDGSGSLDLNEFQEVLDNYKIPGLCASDSQRLFRVFDHNGDGAINFEEFLSTLCEPLSQTRLRLVDEAFAHLDANGNGVLELDEVKAKFDPSRHPEVKQGLKTVEEARFGFYEMFTTFHNASTDFSGEKSVTLAEFREYHTYLNEHYERDAEFRNFLIGVWNMDLRPVAPQDFAGKHTDVRGKNAREQWKYENHKVLFGSRDQQILTHVGQDTVDNAAGVGQSRGNAYNHKSMPMAGSKKSMDFEQTKGINVMGEYAAQRKEQQAYNGRVITGTPNDELLEKVRSKIRARGARGIIGIGKSFRIIDDDRSGSLDAQEFSKILRDYRISTDPLEHKAIFETFDPDSNGQINYDEFLRGIMGQMNQNRVALVKKAFAKIDKDGNGVLTIADIKGTYDASKHPDVLAGKSTEDEILFEFLDTFDESYAIRRGVSSAQRDHRVTLDEFIEYYQNISCSIDNEEYFELMISNTWNLNEAPTPRKAWGTQF